MCGKMEFLVRKLQFMARLRFLTAQYLDNKVVFCTGGNGSICSAQVRALVHLGANACIIGRNKAKTEVVAKELETARPGGKVLGISNIDVRIVEDLQKAVEECVRVFGGIDFLM